MFGFVPVFEYFPAVETDSPRLQIWTPEQDSDDRIHDTKKWLAEVALAKLASRSNNHPLELLIEESTFVRQLLAEIHEADPCELPIPHVAAILDECDKEHAIFTTNTNLSVSLRGEGDFTIDGYLLDPSSEDTLWVSEEEAIQQLIAKGIINFQAFIIELAPRKVIQSISLGKQDLTGNYLPVLSPFIIPAEERVAAKEAAEILALEKSLGF